jgi:hypothetical protein
MKAFHDRPRWRGEQRDDAAALSAAPEHQLDAWTATAWTGGLQIDEVPSRKSLTVCTRNSTYTIVVLRPDTGDVIVRGGRLFPSFQRAVLAGASAGGSLLKMRGIYPGLCMEIVVGGRRVLTSPVASIALASHASYADAGIALDSNGSQYSSSSDELPSWGGSWRP